jgi:hypothetical protein
MAGMTTMDDLVELTTLLITLLEMARKLSAGEQKQLVLAQLGRFHDKLVALIAMQRARTA